MKRYLNIIGITSTLLLAIACDKSPVQPEYPKPDPVTKIGKALVANTDMIASIYKDSAYVLTPGLTVTEFFYLGSHGKTMKTWFFEVDLTQEKLTIENITPRNKPLGSGGSEALTTMLKHVDEPSYYVWGGTNTDFGSSVTGTQGVFHHDGKCYRDEFAEIVENGVARPRSFFYLTKDKKAYTAEAAEYDEIASSVEIEEAFSGSSQVLRNGQVPFIPAHDLSEVHPRTAVGCSKDGNTVWFMVVDGRRYTWSNGMLLEELGAFLKAVGCDSAINLDGGGSSTFVVRTKPGHEDAERFTVKNWPNDNGGQERLLYNGMAIVTKE